MNKSILKRQLKKILWIVSLERNTMVTIFVRIFPRISKSLTQYTQILDTQLSSEVTPVYLAQSS